MREYICGNIGDDFKIMEAENGREGIDKAREFLPDLIISDVMMPEVDGNELTAVLKQDSLTGYIPIILLTAKASDEAKIEGLGVGADDYLTKPFNAEELRLRVNNLITSRQLLREKYKKEFMLEPSEIEVVSEEDAFIQKVRSIIEAELTNPDFTVESLSQQFAMSYRQFSRKLHSISGQAPVQLIRTMRLKRAFQLIREGAGSITEIAFKVGFSNLSYFAKCFKEQFGKLPSEI